MLEYRHRFDIPYRKERTMEPVRQFDAVAYQRWGNTEQDIEMRISVFNWGGTAVVLAFLPYHDYRCVALTSIQCTTKAMLEELKVLVADFIGGPVEAYTLEYVGCL